MKHAGIVMEVRALLNGTRLVIFEDGHSYRTKLDSDAAAIGPEWVGRRAIVTLNSKGLIISIQAASG